MNSAESDFILGIQDCQRGGAIRLFRRPARGDINIA
jgi:hypothetical protein